MAKRDGRECPNRELEILNAFFQTVGIQLEENKEQEGKENQPRTAITKKGQRNPNGGEESDDHTDIDRVMEEQNGYDPVTVKPAKVVFLSFRQVQ